MPGSTLFTLPAAPDGGEGHMIAIPCIRHLSCSRKLPSFTAGQAQLNRSTEGAVFGRRMMQRAVSGRDNVFGEPEFADEDDPIELVSLS